MMTGKKVLVVDANFGAPNLGLHLGIVDPEHTLHDVLSDDVQIQEAIYEHEQGFHILPASLVPKKVNPYKLRNRIESIKNNYDIILLDSSPTLNEEMFATIVASDELLVVTTPDYPTLSTTLHAVKIAKEKKIPIAGLILNKVRNKDFELTIDEIEDAAKVPVLAVIPDELEVLESLSKTLPATSHAPNIDSSVEYKHLAACLINQKYYDNRLKAKVKRLFGSGPSKQEINRGLYKDLGGGWDSN